MKLDILAFAAHPDDVELACSGTIMKHIAQGKKVAVVDLTKGELGTRGSAALRMLESDASSKIMGLSARENLSMPDGFIEYSEKNLKKIITMVRKYQPEIVLANAIKDRHPDHGNAAKLVRDACFYAGLLKYKTINKGKAQDQWRPKSVYFYIQDFYHKPDFVVDVTNFVERKFEAILAFKSQFFEEDMEGPSTPISSKGFMEFLRARMRETGREMHVDYAEGFMVDRAPGVESFFDLK